MKIELNKEQRELVTQNINLVYKVWAGLKNNGVKRAYRDDLLSEGYIGLCYAAYKYNPELGQFGFIAYNSIKHYMYKALKLIKKYTLNEISLQKPIKITEEEEETTLECVIPSDMDIEADAEDADFVHLVRAELEKKFTPLENTMFGFYLLGYPRRKIASFIGKKDTWVRYHMTVMLNFIREEYATDEYN